MLQKVKDSIRIRHDKLDGDIEDNINACKRDLARVGIVAISDDDYLIIQAVKLYAKWQLDFEGQADRYQKAYESLRDSLSLCGDYNRGEDDV